MIDPKELRQNPEAYKDSAKKRGINVEIDKILKLDEDRKALLGQVEGLRAKLNVSGKPSEEELAELKKTKVELDELEVKLDDISVEYQTLILDIPNLIADDTPEGGEEANREESKWGEAKKNQTKSHLDLAQEHGWLDFERGAKVAGNKFYYGIGPYVKLEMAVMRMAMELLEEAGFTLMSTPHLVNNRTLDGTGFQPRGEEDQVYKIEGEDLSLIGTAEISLTGYHADEIIPGESLPLAYAALTPSYRKEAGAYGRHSKGLYRVHQFDKLEMYVFCTPEESEEWHQKLLKIEEDICRRLEIPYRVVRIAAGDLGAPAYKKYDLEYWSPADQEYRELTSCSNCTDFQARRLNIRYRHESQNRFVNTLNGTAVAFSRLFIAIVENHQQPDGSVVLPDALKPYYGGDKL
jgi:seryl-tRNA synthetase